VAGWCFSIEDATTKPEARVGMFEVACKLFELLWFWPRRKKKGNNNQNSKESPAQSEMFPERSLYRLFVG